LERLNQRRVGRIDPAARSLVPLFRREVSPVRSDAEVLTDDHAPVEWLTDRMIVDFIARGGAVDEHPLPTGP